MPRWLRQFTFNKINDFYQKEAEEYENAKGKSSNKSTLIDPSGKVNRENWKQVATPKPSAAKPKTKYK